MGPDPTAVRVKIPFGAAAVMTSCMAKTETTSFTAISVTIKSLAGATAIFSMAVPEMMRFTPVGVGILPMVVPATIP